MTYIHVQHYHNCTFYDNAETKKQLDFIIKKLIEMGQNLDELKQKLDTVNTSLDGIKTNVTGIAEDVSTLKQKINDLQNGATSEQIAELSTLVDGIGAKASALSQSTADLDALTPGAETSAGSDAGGSEETTEG